MSWPSWLVHTLGNLLAFWKCCFKETLDSKEVLLASLFVERLKTQDPHPHFHFHCSKRHWLRFSPMLLSSPLLSKPVLSRTGSVCLSIRSSICGSSLQGIRYCAFWCQVQSQSADLICEPVYKKSIWRRCSIVSRATTRALSPSGKRGPGLWMPCFHLSWVFVLFFFRFTYHSWY